MGAKEFPSLYVATRGNSILHGKYTSLLLLTNWQFLLKTISFFLKSINKKMQSIFPTAPKDSF